MRRSLTAAVLACALAGCAAPTAHAADPCANAQFRPGPAANLPDCRAWEQVSPAKKNGNSLLPTISMGISPDGNGAFFVGTGDFGGAEGLPLQNAYVARRNSLWDTTPLDPPLPPPPSLLFAATLATSVDMSKALVVSSRKLTPDAVDDATNLYIRDTADGSVTLAFSTPGIALHGQLTSLTTTSFYGASPDLSSFAFATNLKLTPDAPGNRDDLYRWSAATGLELISRLPGNAPAPNGAGSSTGFAQDRHPFSDDGRLFTMEILDENANNLLYQRTPTGTRLIARYEVGARAGEPALQRGYFASPSGERITFVAGGQLTDRSDPTPGSDSIYRWDADGDTIVDLLAPVVAPGVSPSISGSLRYVSPDGNFVWFASRGALTPDATDGVVQLFVLDVNAQRLTRVVEFTDPNEAQIGAAYGFSRDGTKATIRSVSKLTGYDNENAACYERITGIRGQCTQIFTYDAEQTTPNLRCVSCGTEPQGRANAGVGVDAAAVGGFEPHPVTNDGRVFFDSPARLAPADVNALSDVYEYTPGGGTRLLSSGTGETEATFAEATASGDNVFFYTADPLVGQDADSLIDLYTARVGGGIAGQQAAPAAAAPCEGSACQGEAPGVVPPAQPGSESFFGAPARPSFRVSGVSAGARRAAARSGRLSVSVRVGALGRVTARLRAKVGGRTRTVASTRVDASKAGTVRLTLRLSAAARRELARKRKLRVTLTVTFADRSPATSSFTLTASSKKGGAR